MINSVTNFSVFSENKSLSSINSFKIRSKLISGPVKLSFQSEETQNKWLQNIVKTLKENEDEVFEKGEEGSFELEIIQDPILLSLQKQGYIFASQALNSQKGAVWEKIRSFKSFPLIEQLIFLQLSCEYNKLTLKNNEIYTIVAFALKEATKAVKENREKQAIELVAKLLYFTNLNPKNIDTLLQEIPKENWISVIEQEFDLEIQKAKNCLKDHMKEHQKNCLQDLRLVEEAKTNLIIANMILCETGYINFGLFSIIKQNFIKESHFLSPAKRHLCHMLAELRRSPFLREKFLYIQDPDQSLDYFYHILLKLPVNTEISRYHAKKAVLVCLLSHFEDPEIKKEFFLTDLIAIIQSKPECYVSDFIDLLTTGSLVRFVEGKRIDFPLKLPTTRYELDKKVSINCNGYLASGGYLWESPGLLNTAKVFDIKPEEFKNEILSISKALFMKNSKSNLAQLNLKRIFSEVVLHLKPLKNVKDDLKKKMDLSPYFYESETGNIVRERLHEIIISLAETHLITKFQNKTETALKTVLTEYVQKLSSESWADYSEDVLDEFFLNYKNKIIFKFNKKQNSYAPYHYENEFFADSTTNFQSLISAICRSSIDPFDHEILQQKCLEYINSNNFLYDILKEYNDSSNCKSYPWKEKVQMNALELLESYFQLGNILPITVSQEVFLPHELLKYLIISGKKGMEFPTIDCPVLEEAWKDKKSADEWILDRFEEKGKKISEMTLNNSELLKITRFAEKLIKPEDIEEVNFEIIRLCENIPLVHCFKKFLSIIMRHASPEAPTLSKITKALIKFICTEALTEKKREDLFQMAIPFREVGRDNSDTHLCFFYNPIYQKIELWEVEETNIKPIDKDEMELKKLDEKKLF